MKTFKFYIGTKAGECARNTMYGDCTFSKAQVVEAIERMRTVYNTITEHIFPKIEGYSLYTVDGYWNGVQETSYVLEVMIDSMNYGPFAKAIRDELHQDSVMATVQDCEVEFF